MTDRSVLVRIRGDVSDLNRALLAGGQNVRGFAHELETADGRMANIIQTSLALAPALIPIGAAAIPAVAGLTVQLGLAAGAAGVALLAFHGVGDALKALDAYQVAPTEANFAKLQQTLDKLGPSGQEFVLALDQIKPKLQQLQDVAEAGVLPGVSDGLNSLLTQLPEVQDVIYTISTTLGDLARESGTALGGPEVQAFFQYLDTTARPVLTDMGHTLGNFLAGFAHLVMAFDPLTRSFSTGLLHASENFAASTENLDQNQGFQDFLAYVEKAGPAALDALESLGGALIQLVEAGAPVGEHLLPVISTLADVLGAIADSPVGPILITTAAGIGVLGRSLALLKAVGLRGSGDSVIGKALGVPDLKSYIPAARAATAATDKLTAASKAQLAARQQYLATLRGNSLQMELLPGATPSKRAIQAANELVAANKKQVTAAAEVEKAEKAKAEAAAASRSAMIKSAAVVGGLALATSGYADKTGLANTASLALLGTIAGPWGAAVGGAVGLVQDLAGANNDLTDAIRNADSAAKGNDYATQVAAVQQLAAATKDYQDTVSKARPTNIFDLKAGLNVKAELTGFADLFTHSADEAAAATQKQQDALFRVQGTYRSLADEMGKPLPANASIEDFQAFAAKIAPALQQAGISLRDLANHGDSVDFQRAAQAIEQYNSAAESASGKSKVVGDALVQLGNEMDTNVSQANALKSALDSLFGVELNQSAATDAWTRSLQSLRDSLKKTNGDITSNKKVALDARDGIRAYVQASLQKIEADAAADGNGRKAARTLLETRNNIIAMAHAAGASKKDIAALIAQMGLTPKNLATIVKTPGLLSAKQQLLALQEIYGLTPRQLRTLISLPGMEKAKANIDELAKKYKLTPRQVTTLLTQPGIGKSKASIDALAKKYNMTPREVRTLLAALDHASGVIDKVAREANNLDGKRATVTINTVHNDSFNTKRRSVPNALGGLYFGDGGYDVADGHQPELAAGGAIRIWAEPETQGEAYIPLANDGRRGRAMDLVDAVAAHFGGQVAWNAHGSIRYAEPSAAARSRGAQVVRFTGGTLEIPGLGPAIIRHATGVVEDYYAGEDELAGLRMRDGVNV